MVLAHAHHILKKSSILKCFMELSSCLQQECQLEQVWLEIAGDSYGSSFESSGFDLMGKQEESTSRVGS